MTLLHKVMRVFRYPKSQEVNQPPQTIFNDKVIDLRAECIKREFRL